jgi:hypothetical protein
VVLPDPMKPARQARRRRGEAPDEIEMEWRDSGKGSEAVSRASES